MTIWQPYAVLIKYPFLCIHCLKDWKGGLKFSAFNLFANHRLLVKKKKKGKEQNHLRLAFTLPHDCLHKLYWSQTDGQPAAVTQDQGPEGSVCEAASTAGPQSQLLLLLNTSSVALSGPASLVPTSEDPTVLSQTRNVNRPWLSAASWEPARIVYFEHVPCGAAPLWRGYLSNGEGRVWPGMLPYPRGRWCPLLKGLGKQ